MKLHFEELLRANFRFGRMWGDTIVISITEWLKRIMKLSLISWVMKIYIFISLLKNISIILISVQVSVLCLIVLCFLINSRAHWIGIISSVKPIKSVLAILKKSKETYAKSYQFHLLMQIFLRMKWFFLSIWSQVVYTEHLI